MTRERFSEYMRTRFARCENTFDSKNKEYATADNFMRNFENGIGISTCHTPEAVAWNYATKHLESIRSIISDLDGGALEPSPSLVTEKFGDAINYLIIIEAMLLHRNENV